LIEEILKLRDENEKLRKELEERMKSRREFPPDFPGGV
jgi:hypothetical protein